MEDSFVNDKWVRVSYELLRREDLECRRGEVTSIGGNAEGGDVGVGIEVGIGNASLTEERRLKGWAIADGKVDGLGDRSEFLEDGRGIDAT